MYVYIYICKCVMHVSIYIPHQPKRWGPSARFVRKKTKDLIFSYEVFPGLQNSECIGSFSSNEFT